MSCLSCPHTDNFRTEIVDFRGFDSNIILILRGEMIMSIGNSPESLSQAILVGVILVGRLAVSLEHQLAPMRAASHFAPAFLEHQLALVILIEPVTGVSKPVIREPLQNT